MIRRLALLTGLVLMASVTGNAEEAERGEWMPEILQAKGADRPYLPDYSYAGYGFGLQALPETKGKVFDAADFGAKPNDERDDTEAIRKTIAAATKHDGPVIVRLPKGRLIVTQIIWIERGDLVLQGAGSGEGGTELHMPQPLEKMKLPESYEKRREYLIKHDKRVRGQLFSLFSWGGGVIWTQHPKQRTQRVAKATAGNRGEHAVTVDDASKFRVGQTFELRWYNREGKDGSLLQHIYGTTELRFGERLWEDPDRALVKQPLTVTAIEGDTVRFVEPLLHDVKAAWTPTVHTTAHLENVGIEGLRVTFPKTQYRGHHLEAGYNAFFLTDLAHSWMRDIVVEHGDAAVLQGSSRNVTIEKIKVIGRGGHYTVHMGSVYGGLVRDFEFHAPAVHSPSFNTHCCASVYSGGVVHEGRLDQHNGVNHQNLFDDIEVIYDRPNDDLFNHGGAGYWAPTAGAFNTMWNVRVTYRDKPHDLPHLPGRIGDAPFARIVGMRANVPIELKYGPHAYIEGLNRKGIAVPSLYAWQLKQRASGGSVGAKDSAR